MPRRCTDHDPTKEPHGSHRSLPSGASPRHATPEFDLEVHNGKARQTVGGSSCDGHRSRAIWLVIRVWRKSARSTFRCALTNANPAGVAFVARREPQQ